MLGRIVDCISFDVFDRYDDLIGLFVWLLVWVILIRLV